MSAARQIALTLVWLAAISAADAQPVRGPAASFQEVTKWHVGYEDDALGMVEGLAACAWTGQPAPACHLVFRHPTTQALVELHADSSAITLRPDGLTLVLRGTNAISGAAQARPSPGDAGPTAADGETARIVVRNDETAVTTNVAVHAAATPDSDLATLDLEYAANGNLDGEWRVRASPLTHRDAAGRGRSGVFAVLPDPGDAAATTTTGASVARAGFFSGVQWGRETWRPALPQYIGVAVLEDAADLDWEALRYPYGPSRGAGRERQYPYADGLESQYRTIVVLGRFLPADEGRSLTPPKAQGTPLTYGVLATRDPDGMLHTNFDRQEIGARFEQGFRTLTAGAPDEIARDARKLEGALLRVRLDTKPPPGPQLVEWGGAPFSWMLQYGENVADVRFVRFVRAEGNAIETEAISQLALPEEVWVEVDTGIALDDDRLPVRIGGPAASNGELKLTANRANCRGTPAPTRYCTPPIIFATADDVPAAAGQQVVLVRADEKVQATIDRAETRFLRANIADAIAAKPNDLWLDALHTVRSCPDVKTDFPEIEPLFGLAQLCAPARANRAHDDSASRSWLACRCRLSDRLAAKAARYRGLRCARHPRRPCRHGGAAESVPYGNERADSPAGRPPGCRHR